MKEIQITEKVTYPAFSEFNINGTFVLLLLKFHNYFNGLIGLDILSTIKVNINFKNLILQKSTANIPIQIEQNRTTAIFNIEDNSGRTVQIPVNWEQGPILLNSVELAEDVYIPEWLYTADKCSAWMEVVN